MALKSLAAVSMTAFLLAPAALVPAATLEVDGLIEPNMVVDVGTPAEGIVEKVAVDRSSLIGKGEPLVQLESSVETMAVKKAKLVASFDGIIHLQQAQLDFAKRVHNRLRELNAVSIQDKDQAATDVVLTLHRLEKAKEERELAAIELKKAEAVLKRRTIRSPISGIVTERYVSPGEYVNNQPLLRIAQVDPLRIETIIAAQYFGRLQPGMQARVVPELAEYKHRTAVVTVIDRVIDSASNTFRVRLELPNSDNEIPSGLRCLVQFEINESATAE